MFTAATLAAFLAAAQTKVDADYAQFQAHSDVKLAGPRLSLEIGRRYMRWTGVA